MVERVPGTTWKLTLCYDGTLFHGWQVQPGRRTVQGELAQAIERITGEETLPQGSGRTDAGVHALAQVASVRLRTPIPALNFERALNHVLPSAVRVLAARHAEAGFHARHSALAKTYEYRVSQAVLCPPWHAPYVCHFTYPLDLARLQAAAAAVVGTHDFRSFQAHDPDAAAREAEGQEPPTVRTIFASGWSRTGPLDLVYRVRGSGFLHHMVRNLVGTFLEIGRGRLQPDSMGEVLRARDRAAAGPTAPACGLWLHSVEYPEATKTRCYAEAADKSQP